MQFKRQKPLIILLLLSAVMISMVISDPAGVYNVVDYNGAVIRELLVDLNEKYAESSWLAVGDPDNDGKNEIILATGKGDRTKPGISHVVLVEKE